METPFSKGFGSMLGAVGFRRDRGRLWVRDNEEVYQLIDLQKSQYGELLYVNTAVILKEIWPRESKLATRHGHLVERLNATHAEAIELLEHPRDLDDGAAAVLRDDLMTQIEAYFGRFDSADKLREYALTVEKVVPIPRRELREWAGFDFSQWQRLQLDDR